MPKPLGELLINQRLITQNMLDQALALQKQRQVPLGRILLQLGYVTEEDLNTILAKQFGSIYINPRGFVLKDNAVLSFIPENAARKYYCFPIELIDQNLTIAMADPWDTEAIDDLTKLTNLTIQPIFSRKEWILQIIDKYYPMISKEENKIPNNKNTSPSQPAPPSATDQVIAPPSVSPAPIPVPPPIETLKPEQSESIPAAINEQPSIPIPSTPVPPVSISPESVSPTPVPSAPMPPASVLPESVPQTPVQPESIPTVSLPPTPTSSTPVPSTPVSTEPTSPAPTPPASIPSTPAPSTAISSTQVPPTPAPPVPVQPIPAPPETTASSPKIEQKIPINGSPTRETKPPEVDHISVPNNTVTVQPKPLTNPVSPTVESQNISTMLLTKPIPELTFENFVVGTSNQLAWAAAKNVAETPGTAYNPLFIYGGVGLGKTHLANAIGNLALKKNPDFTLTYVPCNRFIEEMINAIATGTVNAFRNQYWHLQILIIDDVQFLAGQERTQVELFQTFEELHHRRAQVVLTCDRLPKDIPQLEDRLRSRFEGGLIVDVQMPDLETRVAILRRKAMQRNLELPDDIANVIATFISTNVRELEGVLNKICAIANLSGRPITLQVVENILREIIKQGR